MKDFLRDTLRSIMRDFEHVDPPFNHLIVGFILLVNVSVLLGLPVGTFYLARFLWGYHYLLVVVPAGVVTLSAIIGYYVSKFVNGQASNTEEIQANESL